MGSIMLCLQCLGGLLMVGAKFIDENGGGPGGRLRKRQSKKLQERL